MCAPSTPVIGDPDPARCPGAALTPVCPVPPVVSAAPGATAVIAVAVARLYLFLRSGRTAAAVARLLRTRSVTAAAAARTVVMLALSFTG